MVCFFFIEGQATKTKRLDKHSDFANRPSVLFRRLTTQRALDRREPRRLRQLNRPSTRSEGRGKLFADKLLRLFFFGCNRRMAGLVRSALVGLFPWSPRGKNEVNNNKILDEIDCKLRNGRPANEAIGGRLLASWWVMGRVEWGGCGCAALCDPVRPWELEPRGAKRRWETVFAALAMERGTVSSAGPSILS
jgi:hypothetical protein